MWFPEPLLLSNVIVLIPASRLSLVSYILIVLELINSGKYWALSTNKPVFTPTLISKGALDPDWYIIGSPVSNWWSLRNTILP